MKRLLLFISLSLFTLAAFSQRQERVQIYYDENWKGSSSPSKAAFYRVFMYDHQSGKIVGKVIDYYVTGQMYSEIEGALYIDTNDDSKSIFTGYRRGFYTNGNKLYECEYKNGKLQGSYLVYYPDGKPYRLSIYSNGKRDQVYLEWNKDGTLFCRYYENFSSDMVIREWVSWNDYNITTGKTKEGLLVKNRSGGGYGSVTEIPLDFEGTFSIRTDIDFKKGNRRDLHGLIWGFEDWNNFRYFLIDVKGAYIIGATIKGEDYPIRSGDSRFINKNRNTLSFIRYGRKCDYLINGQKVFSGDFYEYDGYLYGFYTAGKNEVLFKNLVAWQPITERDWHPTGSGIFIDNRGYIATNHHVIKDAREIQVQFIRDGQLQKFKAEVVKSDSQNDLAVLKIVDNSFKPFVNIPYNFKTTESDVGTSVFALGYPKVYLLGEEVKFTEGSISSRTGAYGSLCYQLSVPLQPGNSGGPLFDSDGNLVGINTFKLSHIYPDLENVTFAVKSSYLKSLVETLPMSLMLPSDKTIANKTKTEKIKILTDYVVQINTKK